VVHVDHGARWHICAITAGTALDLASFSTTLGWHICATVSVAGLNTARGAFTKPLISLVRDFPHWRYLLPCFLCGFFHEVRDFPHSSLAC
jgi:hypothetical protein